MSPEIDPRENKKRNRRSTGWLPNFGSLLPERFYVREFVVVGIFAMVAGGAYDFVHFIYNNPRYRAEVVVKGLDELDREQIINKLSTSGHVLNHTSLVALDAGKINETLESEIPRLKEVRVHKDYPNRLLIEVEERQPVALMARNRGGSERIYLPVGRNGVVFQPTEKEVKKLPDRLPVVRGLLSTKPGSPKFSRKWKRVKQILTAVEEVFDGNRLNWIKVRTGGYVVVEINRPKTLKVRLGKGQYSRKMAKLRTMTRTEQFDEIKQYVDLSDLENIRIL